MFCEGIVERCNIEVLRYTQSSGRVLRPHSCFIGAARGLFDTIERSEKQICGRCEVLCEAAAKVSLRILMWIKANRSPCDGRTCCQAAGSGNLDILQLATSEKCRWNHQTCMGVS